VASFKQPNGYLSLNKGKIFESFYHRQIKAPHANLLLLQKGFPKTGASGPLDKVPETEVLPGRENCHGAGR